MDTEYSKYEPLFGSWNIVKLIGEGNYGKVFEIEREDFGKTYKAALKIISIPKNRSDIESAMYEGMDEESVSTYFRSFVVEMTKEFALMDRLKGKTNVVNYLDHQVIEHQDDIGWDVLIRMELLTPLNRYIKENEITRTDVAQLGVDICNALEACEQLNIIHRDIKVENIFVSEFGDYKLGDFGIARVAEKTTGASTKIGTNSYMAPEIMRGENYDGRVDIYSLGLVLYRLLNRNRLPFLPAAPEPITYSHREEANAKRLRGIEFPEPVDSDDSLTEIIRKATAYDPSARYQNAKEFKTALERYIAIQNGDEEVIDPAPIIPVEPPLEEPVIPDDEDTKTLLVPKPVEEDKQEIPEKKINKKLIWSLAIAAVMLISIVLGVILICFNRSLLAKDANEDDFYVEKDTTSNDAASEIDYKIEDETDDQSEPATETEEQKEADNVYVYEEWGIKITLPDDWSLNDLNGELFICNNIDKEDPNWISIYKQNAMSTREDRRGLCASAGKESLWEVSRVEIIDFLGKDIESVYLEDSDNGESTIRAVLIDHGDYSVGMRFFSPTGGKDKIDEMMSFFSAYPETESPKEYAGMTVKLPADWTQIKNPGDSSYEFLAVPTEEYTDMQEGEIATFNTFAGVRSDKDGSEGWVDDIWYKNTWGDWEIGTMYFMGKERFFTEGVTENQQICRYIFIALPENYNKLYYAVVLHADSKDEIEDLANYFVAK